MIHKDDDAGSHDGLDVGQDCSAISGLLYERLASLHWSRIKLATLKSPSIRVLKNGDLSMKTLLWTDHS